LSSTESGALAGAFMVGFMFFSPVFAHLSKIYTITVLMGVGKEKYQTRL
jgi:hypothetical protein